MIVSVQSRNLWKFSRVYFHLGCQFGWRLSFQLSFTIKEIIYNRYGFSGLFTLWSGTVWQARGGSPHHEVTFDVGISHLTLNCRAPRAIELTLRLHWPVAWFWPGVIFRCLSMIVNIWYQKFRNENFDQGFWSLIVCLVGALSETVFGLASFVTCLHYSDVVERLQLYSEVKQLAEEYPEYYG